jgi:deferrochelatase/peroxidase EfeB
MTTASPGTNAQRLVTKGYKGLYRRNYLIQLYEDYECILEVKSTADAFALLEKRRESWRESGALPRSVFLALIAKWIDEKYINAKASISGYDNFAQTPPSPQFFVDLGLTFQGILRLKVHHQLEDLFRRKAPAFTQGAFYRASAYLGDSGLSDPTYWEDRYQNSNLHCVLVVHAKSEADNKAFLSFETHITAALSVGIELKKLEPPACFLPTVELELLNRHWIEGSALVGAPNELHFGMLDGLSVPRFRDVDSEKSYNEEALFNQHEAGELLLGYARNDKSNPWLVPGVYASERASPEPSKVPERGAYPAFFRDSTFGIFRKIQQDVPKFDAFLLKQGQRIEGQFSETVYSPNLADPDYKHLRLEYAQAWIKAKMVGRWPNGEEVDDSVSPPSVAQAKSRIVPQSVTKSINNNFSFKEDLEGLNCPFGAHIRRLNPRDDPIVPKLRRPILRRGASYGSKFEASKNEAENRGLLGLFFCASIEDQFEHLLGNWANNNPMGLPFKQPSKDPIIGNHEADTGSFDIPMRDGSSMNLPGLSAFVQTRGTCYAFFPSVASLKLIAANKLMSATEFLQNGSEN